MRHCAVSAQREKCDKDRAEGARQKEEEREGKVGGKRGGKYLLSRIPEPEDLFSSSWKM